jgi:hypothetical protein
MRVVLDVPAPPDARFGPQAFDKALGSATLVGGAQATVTDAEVAEDGRTARLTFELARAGDLEEVLLFGLDKVVELDRLEPTGERRPITADELEAFIKLDAERITNELGYDWEDLPGAIAFAAVEELIWGAAELEGLVKGRDTTLEELGIILGILNDKGAEI